MLLSLMPQQSAALGGCCGKFRDSYFGAVAKALGKKDVHPNAFLHIGKKQVYTNYSELDSEMKLSSFILRNGRFIYN